jgi:S-disulfanyl-L-cysteine oxidoreductase SoxD
MKMKLGIFAIIGAAAMVASYATVRAAQDMGKTTWDGVYSEAQATKGEAVYNDKCSKCHGADGTGGDAPDLVGGGFAADWDGLSVAQLFDRTRSSMPQDNPGSLSRDEAAAIITYLFRKNGFPAGATDMSSAGEYLGQIKYVAVKPAK